jgi:hypothetical protein
MTIRSVELTHDRLMDAWFVIHDILYTPTTSAADVAILIEARTIIADRAKEVLDAKQMHLEDVALEAADMAQNLRDHGRQTDE